MERMSRGFLFSFESKSKLHTLFPEDTDLAGVARWLAEGLVVFKEYLPSCGDIGARFIIL